MSYYFVTSFRVISCLSSHVVLVMPCHVCHVVLCQLSWMPCHAMITQCHAMSVRRSFSNGYQWIFREFLTFLKTNVWIFTPPRELGCSLPVMHDMLCHVTQYHAMSVRRSVMPGHITSSRVIPSYAMSCHVVQCHAMSRHVMPCHGMSCHVTACHDMLRHVMPNRAVPRKSCRDLPCLATSRQLMPHYATFFNIMPLHAISHLVLLCYAVSLLLKHFRVTDTDSYDVEWLESTLQIQRKLLNRATIQSSTCLYVRVLLSEFSIRLSETMSTKVSHVINKDNNACWCTEVSYVCVHRPNIYKSQPFWCTYVNYACVHRSSMSVYVGQPCCGTEVTALVYKGQPCWCTMVNHAGVQR